MFRIKTNNEVLLGKIDNDDETVAEAIYSTYSDYTYDISLMWNNFVIPLDRRGDISDMYNDITLMLSSLKRNESTLLVSFLSSTFTAKWRIQVESENLRILPKWITVAFSGQQHSDNEENNTLIVPIVDFINEWDDLLRVIKDDLIKVGYGEDLEGFYYLTTL
ncbi:hypothetical protein C5E04_03660 [Pectobacterium parmentieri]|uniref:hypothetical protein n=1 Tax=Pectobacterium parmentieri TaxID=1905730 RepID=UPI000EABD47E|nr:hypothetical protein [Pectobacterium parmentieri]RKO81924.1 hypothetical protein C5E04_03660 [Pectobacterium parmentieri]